VIACPGFGPANRVLRSHAAGIDHATPRVVVRQLPADVIVRIHRSCRVAVLIFFCALAGAPLHALIGAFPSEVEALIHAFDAGPDNPAFTRTSVHGTVFIRGQIDGWEVVIFQAGSSLMNAADQLQLALDRSPIAHVLFAGIAGGIDPALHVGDVVIPEKWTYRPEAAYLHEDGRGGHVTPAWWGKPGHENFGMIFPGSVRTVRDGLTQPRPMESFPADAALLETARARWPS